MHRFLQISTQVGQISREEADVSKISSNVIGSIYSDRFKISHNNYFRDFNGGDITNLRNLSKVRRVSPEICGKDWLKTGTIYLLQMVD